MKNLGIESFTSQRFKNLIYDPLSFRFAVQNTFEDIRERNEMIRQATNLLVMLFTGEKLEEKESIREQVEKELHRRLLDRDEILGKAASLEKIRGVKGK